MLPDVAALDYELVAELERKSLSDEDMTVEELGLLAFVVKLSQPQSGPPGGFIIDEGEEFPPEADEADAEWDRWYQTPIAETLFPRTPRPPVVRVHVPPRLHDRAPRPRRRSSRRRARAPARPDDPEPPLARRRA